MVIAVEGPSNTGKSTLLSGIDNHLDIERYTVLPCYVTFAGGEQQVPNAPAESVEEELRAQNFYRNLDHERMLSIQNNSAISDLVIMDRSIHTILAHAYAVSKIKNIPVYRESQRLALRDPRITWPYAIIYLDTPEDVLSRRYRRSDSSIGIFSNTSYNRHYRKYFLGDISNIYASLEVLDSQHDIDELRSRATEIIHTWYR